jgi:hypothetical protein
MVVFNEKFIGEMATKFFPASAGYTVKPIKIQEIAAGLYTIKNRYRIGICFDGRNIDMRKMNKSNKNLRKFLKMMGHLHVSPTWISFEPNEITVEFE